MEKTFLILLILLAFVSAVNCTRYSRPTSPSTTTPREVEIVQIPLLGPIAHRNSEISGLAWYKDHLILLPQYPNRFDDKLFAIPKTRLHAFVAGQDTSPITPLEIDFISLGITENIASFEGFEAIGFVGNRVFLTIESSPGDMLGFLISGQIEDDMSKITLNTEKIPEIPPQSPIPNACDETLFVTSDNVITIYEGCGKNVNPKPIAHVFDHDLTPQEAIPFPNIEYRITDATALDEHNRFWVINYFWPGEKEVYNPAEDAIAKKYGKGETHSINESVERLLELQYDKGGITLTDEEPIQLKLFPDGSRNWEGIVRLDDLGFILATDKFPETILAFVKR